jgi:hypothetical protein
MNKHTHAVTLRRWMNRAALPVLRRAKHWLVYICAASQMADLSGMPVDEKAVDRYLGRDRKLY